MTPSMPERIGGRVLLVVCSALAIAARAGAQDAESLDGRWLPSLAVGFDVQVESDARANITSSLRAPVSGERQFLTAVPLVEGELATPVLGSGARLFASAEWDFGWLAVGEERPVAVEGTIGSPVLIPPRCQPGNPTRCIQSDLSLVEGMGSRLDAKIENGWGAGLGVSFEVPVADWFTVIVKPSFIYHGETVKLNGQVKNPVLIIGSSPPNNNTASYVEVARSEEDTFHALGGRLAIEYVAASKGPVDVLLYVRGQMFWWLDPETSFDASGEGATAVFDYSRNNFVGGGGVGVRVRWRGP